MNGNGFDTGLLTKKAKTALRLAVNTAGRLGQGYIGSEHILCGLIGEGTGIAAMILTENGATLSGAEALITAFSGRGEPCRLSLSDLNAEAFSIMQSAAEAAASEGAELIGTEHILGAILRDTGCGAVRVLREPHRAVFPMRFLRRSLPGGGKAPAAAAGEVRQGADPPLGLRGL